MQYLECPSIHIGSVVMRCLWKTFTNFDYVWVVICVVSTVLYSISRHEMRGWNLGGSKWGASEKRRGKENKIISYPQPKSSWINKRDIIGDLKYSRLNFDQAKMLVIILKNVDFVSMGAVMCGGLRFQVMAKGRNCSRGGGGGVYFGMLWWRPMWLKTLTYDITEWPRSGCIRTYGLIWSRMVTLFGGEVMSSGFEAVVYAMHRRHLASRFFLLSRQLAVSPVISHQKLSFWDCYDGSSFCLHRHCRLGGKFDNAGGAGNRQLQNYTKCSSATTERAERYPASFKRTEGTWKSYLWTAWHCPSPAVRTYDVNYRSSVWKCYRANASRYDWVWHRHTEIERSFKYVGFAWENPCLANPTYFERERGPKIWKSDFVARRDVDVASWNAEQVRSLFYHPRCRMIPDNSCCKSQTWRCRRAVADAADKQQCAIWNDSFRLRAPKHIPKCGSWGSNQDPDEDGRSVARITGPAQRQDGRCAQKRSGKQCWGGKQSIFWRLPQAPDLLFAIWENGHRPSHIWQMVGWIPNSPLYFHFRSTVLALPLDYSLGSSTLQDCKWPSKYDDEVVTACLQHKSPA